MKFTIKNKKGLLLTAFFLCLLSGCAVQDWSRFKQAYRDFVAYYNAYFHAADIVESSKNTLARNHKDDFQQIINIYPLGSENDAGRVAGELDKAIEKATKVIQGYENSNWVNDSYLLIGKARFYKQDYQKALESFQHLSSRFRGTIQGYEAIVWSIVTNTRMERYNEARSVVSVINNQDGFPEELKKDFLLAQADLQIKRNNFTEAIVALEKAIPLTKRNHEKSRYQFVLAQLYQRRGSMLSANELFGQAARRAPTYEMEFQANFNQVLTMQAVNITEYRAKRRKLNSMIDNENNEPYLDMLYYELGMLEIFARNNNMAIKHFQTSVNKNADNAIQRARTLNMLATLQYEKGQYIRANHNFQELIDASKIKFEGSDTLHRKAINYETVTGHRMSIHLNDSLLKLAKLSDEALFNTLASIIEKIDEDEKLAEKKGLMPAVQPQAGQFDQSETSDGVWYFYNPTALNSGLNQFQATFGERALADNWRYSTLLKEERHTTDEEYDEIIEDYDKKQGEKVETAENEFKGRIDELMAAVPRSPAQQNATNQQILQHYFELGFTYYENLGQYQKTIEVLREMNERYPDNRFLAHSYYLIFSSAQNTGNDNMADEYLGKLQNSFPQSEFTTLATDPEKFQIEYVSQEKIPELEKMFKTAYTAYTENNCVGIKQLSVSADTTFINNYLEANFNYLELLCELRTDTIRNFAPRLEHFINENQGTVLAIHAGNILEYIRKENDTLTGRDPESDISMFTNKRTERHFYCMLFEQGKARISEVTSVLSDFHNHFLNQPGLTIRNNLIGSDMQLIVVYEFENRSEAMIYFNNVKQNEILLENLTISEYEQFVISESNFKELMKNKNKNAYLTFFAKYYE